MILLSTCFHHKKSLRTKYITLKNALVFHSVLTRTIESSEATNSFIRIIKLKLFTLGMKFFFSLSIYIPHVIRVGEIANIIFVVF